MVVEMDNHFVSVNYYAETSEHTNNDETSTSGLRIRDDDISVATNGTVVEERRASVSQTNHVPQRFLTIFGILFIIGSFSLPIILYHIHDRVDLNTFVANFNDSSVS